MLNVKALFISLLAVGVFAAHAEIQCSNDQITNELRSLSEARAKFDKNNKSDFPGFPRQIDSALNISDSDSELSDLLYGGYHLHNGYWLFEETLWGKISRSHALKEIKVRPEVLRANYAGIKNQGNYPLAPMIENTHLVDKLLAAQTCDQMISVLESYKPVQMAAVDGLLGMGTLNQSFNGARSTSEKNSLDEICASSGHQLLASTVLGDVQEWVTSDDTMELALRQKFSFLGNLKYFTAWDAAQYINGVSDDFMRDPSNQKVQDADVELEGLKPPTGAQLAADRAVVAAACPAIQAKEQALVKALIAADNGISAAIDRMDGK